MNFGNVETVIGRRSNETMLRSEGTGSDLDEEYSEGEDVGREGEGFSEENLG